MSTVSMLCTHNNQGPFIDNIQVFELNIFPDELAAQLQKLLLIHSSPWQRSKFCPCAHISVQLLPNGLYFTMWYICRKNPYPACIEHPTNSIDMPRKKKAAKTSTTLNQSHFKLPKDTIPSSSNPLFTYYSQWGSEQANLVYKCWKYVRLPSGM